MNGDVTPPQQNTNPNENIEPTPEQTNVPQPTNTTEPSVAPSTEPSAPAAPPEGQFGDIGHKKSTGKRLVLAVIILALLGGAVWAAMRLSTPAKAPVENAVKKDVALLRVAVQEPTSPAFYPGIENNTLDVQINNQVFEGLTKFENKTRIVPALATSWNNPDTKTWVFDLRKDVKFHNGHAFNAQAVKASIDASKKVDFLSEYNDTIASVTVVNDYSVKIVTATPDPLLLNKLANLWIYDTTGTPNDSSTGTGPYVQKSGTKITKDGVDLVAFDSYYGGRPYVRELVFVHYEDDEAVQKALQDKKIEMGYIDDKSIVSKVSSNYKLYETEGIRVSFIVPNTLKKGSPLANKTVRQAIYTALDPQGFMDARKAEGTASTQPVPPAIPGYNPNIKRPATDTKAAKALLTQAGYPNGFTLKFTYYVNSKDAAEVAQKQLAAIGIKLVLDEQSDGPTLQDIAYNGKTDLYYVSVYSDLVDTSDVYSNLVFQQKNYHSDTITQLNTEAGVTLDPAKRLKLLQQMNETYMADYGSFPLYQLAGNLWAVRKDLQLTQENISSYAGLNFNHIYTD